MKRFKYQPLGKELKLQTDFAKKKTNKPKNQKKKTVSQIRQYL